MKPQNFLRIIDEGLRVLANIGGPAPTDDVRRFLLCIALQESGPELSARYQNSPSSTPGAAKGFFQFEAGGGCRGVLTNQATETLAKQLCEECAVLAEQSAVWRALEGHDLLAVGFARLLVYSDASPLPQNEQEGWAYYMRTWRPGRPDPDRWTANWAQADATLREST